MIDTQAQQGVQISISPNGAWLWVNVDGICVARIKIIDKATIEIEDSRKTEHLIGI